MTVSSIVSNRVLCFLIESFLSFVACPAGFTGLQAGATCMTASGKLQALVTCARSLVCSHACLCRLLEEREILSLLPCVRLECIICVHLVNDASHTHRHAGRGATCQTCALLSCMRATRARSSVRRLSHRAESADTASKRAAPSSLLAYAPAIPHTCRLGHHTRRSFDASIYARPDGSNT